jgi:hypothetical protein
MDSVTWYYACLFIVIQATTIVAAVASLFEKLPLSKRISFFCVSCGRVAVSILVAVLCLRWLDQESHIEAIWILQVMLLVGVLDHIASVLSQRRILGMKVPAMWDVFIRNR